MEGNLFTQMSRKFYSQCMQVEGTVVMWMTLANKIMYFMGKRVNEFIFFSGIFESNVIMNVNENRLI